jgi:hypothetical protein
MNLSYGSPSKDEGEGRTFGTYRYELELLPKDGAIRKINSETLRKKIDGRGKWMRVFERRPDGTIRGSRTFPLSGYGQVIDKIRDDASVISTLALFEHGPSQLITGSTRSILSNILVDRIEPNDDMALQYICRDQDLVDALNLELQRIDVGIKEMKIVQSASGPIPVFTHQGLHVDMPWILESHGTRSFIRLFPMLFLTLKKGGISIIDELDISIHPLLLPEILRWFYDTKRNPDDAQLWASCHSVSLLDELTKEEIVLCEKDRRGRSHFYRLADVQAVRRSDNLYRKYLGGMYGAVPHIG